MRSSTPRRSSRAIRTGRANAGHVLQDHHRLLRHAHAADADGVDRRSPSRAWRIIKPYDTSQIDAMEKAIRDSDLGVNPNNEGTQLRILLPQMTEERRRDMIKVARHKGEEAKVAIRNIRRQGQGGAGPHRQGRRGRRGRRSPRREGTRRPDPAVRGQHRRAGQAQGNRAARGLMALPDVSDLRRAPEARRRVPAARRSRWKPASVRSRSGRRSSCPRARRRRAPIEG